MAIEQIHQLAELGILAIHFEAEIAHDGIAVEPAFFALQPTQRQPVTVRRRQPSFLTAAGDQNLGLAAA
jgi:hypothetical protein